MKKIMIFAVLVIVSMTAFAQVSKEEQELIDLSNQKWTWMAEKNADRLSELFLENAQFVHMGGYWGKAQELQIIRSGGIWYTNRRVSGRWCSSSAATLPSSIMPTEAMPRLSTCPNRISRATATSCSKRRTTPRLPTLLPGGWRSIICK